MLGRQTRGGGSGRLYGREDGQVSPVYALGDQLVRRKNWYMPCAIGPRFDEATPEEQAEILKATYWCDYVTGSEWPALLGDEDCSPSARSRLKKKAAGWAIVLGRMAALNPELLAEVLQRARSEYERLIETPYPGVAVSAEVAFPATAKAWREQDGKAAMEIGIRIDDREELRDE